MSLHPLRILIAEDEPLARERLRKLLHKELDLEIVAEAVDGPQAVAFARLHRPHALLLDVRLPGLNGFEVLAALEKDVPPAVVFLTAYGEHAARAFDARAVDYMMKPFTLERLRQALARVRAHCEPQDRLVSMLHGNNKRTSDRIALRSGTRNVMVALDEIYYALAANTFCQVFTATDTITTNETLTAFQDRLPEARFARISRFAVVNVAHVRSLQPKSNGDQNIFLRDGTILTVTRRKRLPFMRLLKLLASPPGLRF